MQTIIMTVGTSLRTNLDLNLPPEKRRPWANRKVSSNQIMIADHQEAITWMEQTEMELISAETNTLWRLDPKFNDEIILLHSATTSGLECAKILQQFFDLHLAQKNVKLRQIPGINYEIDEDTNALAKMAELLTDLIHEARGTVTLAATGGFKAETMVMAIVGNTLGVPVCYIHEEYKSLVYLPFLAEMGKSKTLVKSADLPNSTRDRETVVNMQMYHIIVQNVGLRSKKCLSKFLGLTMFVMIMLLNVIVFLNKNLRPGSKPTKDLHLRFEHC